MMANRRVNILQKNAFKKAYQHLLEGWNCGQSTLLSVQELLGIENEYVLKATTGFGGGIGNMGALCGALAAGVVFLGLKYGRKRLQEFDEKERTYILCAEWYRRFVNYFGSSNCIDILKVDLSNPEIRKKYWDTGKNREICAKTVVGKAAEMLVKLIKDIEDGKL